MIKEYEQSTFDPKKASSKEEILRKDSWNLEKKIIILINSLDAPEGGTYVDTLSGGEKRRVACAVH